MESHGSSRLQRLRQAGVSIWLDTLSRELLQTGQFQTLVRDYEVTGATSNPTIFAAAITGSDRYDAQLRELTACGSSDPEELFFGLALEDVRKAASELRYVYDSTGGRDGFVSFECTPDLADDTEATTAQALELWERLAAPNVMIKVPGTPAGVPAIEELTRRGVNVNVTLLFSVKRYEQVLDAYLRGQPSPPTSNGRAWRRSAPPTTSSSSTASRASSVRRGARAGDRMADRDRAQPAHGCRPAGPGARPTAGRAAGRRRAGRGRLPARGNERSPDRQRLARGQRRLGQPASA